MALSLAAGDVGCPRLHELVRPARRVWGVGAYIHVSRPAPWFDEVESE
ncbi:uncharacterized protein METZ01_LOCUS273807 [marine metagenome]|uniref:Uncharacterized protein n=1 Tax=marine metagenome TaxID=408172 RepID=A0A382KBR0_9ZZZZ